MMAEPRWAEREVGRARVGDRRRTARRVDRAPTLGTAVAAPVPVACRTPARLPAAYRFFTTAPIDPTALRAPHVTATVERMAGADVVRAVPDPTARADPTHPATSDRGALRTGGGRGLFLHATLAVRPPRADPPGPWVPGRGTPVHGRGVWAHEADPAPGAESVRWLLLTTWPVHTPAAALTIIRWSTGRWSIAVWHRVLTTGAAIEERRN